MNPVLQIDKLRVTFAGRIASVRGLSLRVERGKRIAS